MTLQDKVGKAIVHLRKERGLSQDTFAFEAGIDRRYMSDIENGKRNISLDILERVCQNSASKSANSLWWRKEWNKERE